MLKNILLVLFSVLVMTANSQDNLKSYKDSYSIGRYLPSGEGYILENLVFNTEVFLQNINFKEYQWRAKVRLSQYKVTGYLYKGKIYDVNKLYADAKKYGIPWGTWGSENISFIKVNVLYRNLKTSDVNLEVGSSSAYSYHLFKYKSKGPSPLNGFDIKNIKLIKAVTNSNIRRIVERQNKEKELEKQKKIKAKEKETTNNDDDFWKGKEKKTKVDDDDDDDFWNGKEVLKKENDISNGEGSEIELEIYKEKYNSGLRNKKTKEVVIEANKYKNLKKLYNSNYFTARVRTNKKLRWRDISTSGVLIDKNGVVVLKDYTYIRNEYISTYKKYVLIVKTTKKITFEKNFIGRGIVNGGKQMTSFRRAKTTVLYDLNLNVIRQFEDSRLESCLSKYW